MLKVLVLNAVYFLGSLCHAQIIAKTSVIPNQITKCLEVIAQKGKKNLSYNVVRKPTNDGVEYDLVITPHTAGPEDYISIYSKEGNIKINSLTGMCNQKTKDQNDNVNTQILALYRDTIDKMTKTHMDVMKTAGKSKDEMQMKGQHTQALGIMNLEAQMEQKSAEAIIDFKKNCSYFSSVKEYLDSTDNSPIKLQPTKKSGDTKMIEAIQKAEKQPPK